jgi:hypothetical protein
MADEAALDREIDENYDYFRRHLDEFLARHAGRIALLRARNVVGFYDDAGEADREGRARFSDGLYSLQPVVNEPVDLGFFSHVGH